MTATNFSLVKETEKNLAHRGGHVFERENVRLGGNSKEEKRGWSDSNAVRLCEVGYEGPRVGRCLRRPF